MLGTDVRWSGRIGGFAVIALAASYQPANGSMEPSSLAQTGPAVSRAQGPALPGCGTRPRTDVETVLDAARVADFKKRGRTAKPRGRPSA